MKKLKNIIDNNDFEKLFKSVLNIEIDLSNGEIVLNEYEITIIDHITPTDTTSIRIFYTLSLPQLYIYRSISNFGIEKSYVKSKENKVIKWLLENDYDISDCH